MRLQLQVIVTGNAQQQLGNVTVAVNGVAAAAGNANKQFSSIIKTIRDIRTIIATIESARMFAKIVTEGIQFNSLLDTSRFGLAALIATFTDMTDATGRHLTMIERYNYAQGMAVDLQQRMKIAALQTTLQYSDLLDVMQRGLPFMLKYFHDKDRNVVSNQKLVDFTASFAQGAAAFGLGPEEIGTNIQRLLQGTADARHARFAYALLQDIGGNPAQIKEQLKLWEQQGVLYDRLTAKVQAFKRAGQDMMGTFAGTWSNFKDAIQQALGEGTTGATRELRDLLKEITGHIVVIGADGKSTFNQDFVNTVRDLATVFTALASALAQVAQFLVTTAPVFKEIIKELADPNIPKLISTLLGAIAGGMLGGPGGALLGAAGMYAFRTDTQAMDAIKQRAMDKMASDYRLQQDSLNVTGRLGWDDIRKTFKGTQFEKLANPYTTINPKYGLPDQDEYLGVGKLYNDTGELSASQKLKALIDAAKSSKDGIPHLAAFRSELEKLKSTLNGIKVKSPLIPEDPEEIRRRAAALERYREALTSIIVALDNSKVKNSFAAAMSSFDIAIAQSKADEQYDMTHVNTFKDRDPWHRDEEETKDTTLVPRYNPFHTFQLEAQRDELKALNEYRDRLAEIAKEEQKLNNLKAQAKNSKFTPEDVEKEKEARKRITEALVQNELQYQAKIKEVRTGFETKVDQANNKIRFDMNAQALADEREAWLQHYENRQKMEEEAMQRTVNLYHGLFDTVKQGSRSIVEALMGGGKENPFASIAESFKKTWVEYLGSITDNYMNQLSVIASGEHKPYGYTKPGETGADDPGGLPKYATPGMTRDTRIGMAGLNGAMALYSLYQGGQNGMTRQQGAVQGAMSGASIGAMIGSVIPGVGTIIGAIVGAIVGAVAGALLGKPKIGYNVTVSGGKIQVSGQGSANSQDVSAAMQAINKVVEDTSNNLYGILFSLPASILQAIGSFKPGDMKMDKGRWFNGDSLKLFLQTDVPKMVFDSFAPALQGGLEALGVTKSKLAEIFKRTNDPSFDPKDFIAKLQDYVNIITGLQEVMKLMGTATDDGSGLDARAELAHKTLNKSAYDQISEIDQRIAGISGLFGGMSWDEQIAAGKQVLALAQQRNQIEMQALDSLRAAWINIRDTVDQNKDSIRYNELSDPNDPSGTAARQAGYWRGKAAGAMTNLLGLMNDPNATLDDVNKYAQEAQTAAMNLYQTMKTRYEDEMALVKQIAQAVKDVSKGFNDAKFAINYDQARLGTDADGNPIYDKKKQADMILAQQRNLFDQLKVATDPAEVARISGEIQKNASQLYDLWGRTPDAAKQVLAQLTDAGDLARATLKRLGDEAAAEAQKYKDAANEALAILTATADIANAVIAGMKTKIEQLDPNAYHNLDTVLGALGVTTDTTTTNIDELGNASMRTSGKLDEFGDNLLSWSRRFDTDSHSDSGNNSVRATSNAASNSGAAPVIILNGSMAAVASEVEVRIGNKIYRRVVNTQQKREAGGTF